MTSLFLAPHAFVCFVDDRYIFLDLIKDKYVGLSIAKSKTVQSLANGSARLGQTETQSLGGLRAAGLLADSGTSGKPFKPTAAPASRRDLFDLPEPRLRPSGAIPGILMSCIKASWTLKFDALVASLEKIARRRAATQGKSNPDIDAMCALSASFNRLRPVYPRKPVCLHDSLALLEYLAGYGFFPNCVFGVTAEPFRAHCWVQYEDIVLNDYIDRVAPYTPIMVA